MNDTDLESASSASFADFPDSTAPNIVKPPAQSLAGPWPAVSAVFIAWVLPKTTATRTQHVPLTYAWFIHFVAALLSAMLIVTFVSFVDSREALSLGGLMEAAGSGINEIYNELDVDPFVAIFTVLGVVILIELGFVALAAMVAPWGARDEPLRATYVSALRRTWLQSAALPYAALYVGVFGHALFTANREWNAANLAAIQVWPSAPQPVSLAPDDPAYAQASEEYDAAVAEYNRKITRYYEGYSTVRAKQPWYARNPNSTILLFLSVCLTVLWSCWGLFRAVGAPRDVVLATRPPTCETCGYNLTMLPMDARCPECGESVIASLGPDSRTGPDWERRISVGQAHAWWRTAKSALRGPASFGRTLSVANDRIDHRLYFAVALPIIVLIGMTGLLTHGVTRGGTSFLAEGFALPLLVAFLFGSVCALGAVGFTMAGVTLVGLTLSLREKRNLLPGAMRVGCYLAPYLVLWASFGAFWIWFTFVLAESNFFANWGQRTRINEEFLGFLFWLLPNLAWAVHFLLFLARGTNATRYANR